MMDAEAKVIDEELATTGEEEKEAEGTMVDEKAGDSTPNPSEDEGSDTDDEVIVTIGDAEPPAEEHTKAPEWVRELRKAHRETQKENRALREKLKSLENPAQPEEQVGPKPRLSDYEYDTDQYEQALADWYERKRKADDVAAQREADQKAADEAWQQQLNAYGEAKANLKVSDFDDAEAAMLELLDQTQYGIIVQGAKNAAVLLYALWKNPEKAKELAAIKDPVKFSWAASDIEKESKVTKRKAPPPPEKKVEGTTPGSGSVDSTLERLRAEASKTGDFSKVTAYRREQKTLRT